MERIIDSPADSLFRGIGRMVLDAFEYAFNLFLLFVAVARAFGRQVVSARRRILRDTAYNQIIFTVVDALPIVGVIALGLGVVVIVQMFSQLTRLGASEFIGRILVLVFVREMSTLLTALLIISRSGSAMSTELGNMRVSQETDALEAMGIDILQFIVLPRAAAAIIGMVCLATFFNLVAIFGGFLVTVVLGMRSGFWVFLQSILAALSLKDVLIYLGKCVAFGIIIPIVACYHGLSVQSSPTEVPAQTTTGIVNSIVLCFMVGALLTVVSYL
jgi:phospholipid/cholesterol/gamma-HCH transport system permease protein